MSGPKTSRYILSAEQRRKIEEEQRIIREIKVAQNKNANLKRKCTSYLSELESVIAELEIISKASGRETEVLLQLEKRDSEIRELLSRDLIQGDLRYIQSENNRLDIISREVQNLIARGRVSSHNASVAYKNELEDVITEGLKLSFSGLGNDRRMRENPFMIKINAALEKIETYDLSEELYERFERLKKKANEIQDIDYLENFCSLQVYPFVHECEYYRNHIEEFEDILAQYTYLVKEVGERAREFSFSESNLLRLEQEIERLNQILIRQKEQEYINQAVDEAMIEMGYEMVGERFVTKKSGKRFKSGLYALEAGTAVNVTFSESGQISMELGALDTVDRVPTEAEAVELEDDMRSFCEDYVKVENKLMEKGIITRKLSMLPPAAEYAQVFNTIDYELKKPLGSYKCKKKRKAVMGKHMQSEV